MFNSIRTRLTLWFTGVLAVILIAFAVATYLFLGYAIRRQTDAALRQIAKTFADAVGNEQRESEESDAAQNGESIDAIREAMSDLRFRNYAIFVADAGGKILLTDDNQTTEKSSLPREQMTKLAADFSASGEDFAFSRLRSNESDFRVFARRAAHDGAIKFNVFVVYALDEDEEFLYRFRDVLLVSVPLLLAAVSFGGYFLARKTLAPVAAMSRTAASIGATNLNERLPVENEKDELGSLAIVFNSLLGRLENSFETQRRFMADASHELRTPLAIVRGESEVAVSKPNRPNAELYESLNVVHDESKRLTRIVEDLFTLARADSGHFKTNFKEFYLDELLADCLRKVRVLADKRRVALRLEALAEMPMRGDEQLVRRLLMNLLDKARSRTAERLTSGAGLGLSIAQWIAEIHQGKIELVSSDEIGSVFAVVFPPRKIRQLISAIAKNKFAASLIRQTVSLPLFSFG